MFAVASCGGAADEPAPMFEVVHPNCGAPVSRFQVTTWCADGYPVGVHCSVSPDADRCYAALTDLDHGDAFFCCDATVKP